MTTTYTKEEAKDKMLEAFDKDLVVGARYFRSNGTRCAIGWLLPEEAAKTLEKYQSDHYPLAEELVEDGIICISDMDKLSASIWLSRIQNAVDNGIFFLARELIYDV